MLMPGFIQIRPAGDRLPEFSQRFAVWETVRLAPKHCSLGEMRFRQSRIQRQGLLDGGKPFLFPLRIIGAVLVRFERKRRRDMTAEGRTHDRDWRTVRAARWPDPRSIHCCDRDEKGRAGTDRKPRDLHFRFPRVAASPARPRGHALGVGRLQSVSDLNAQRNRRQHIEVLLSNTFAKSLAIEHFHHEK